MESVLTKKQVKTFMKQYKKDGRHYRITATIHFDDQCGNGHNTFSITGEVAWLIPGGRWYDEIAGCIHDEIARHFPELAPYIKWHLCSTDGPIHYIANTLYHVKEGNLDFARSSAIWPDAKPEDLTEENLQARLPALLAEFRNAVESLGFTY